MVKMTAVDAYEPTTGELIPELKQFEDWLDEYFDELKNDGDAKYIELSWLDNEIEFFSNNGPEDEDRAIGLAQLKKWMEKNGVDAIL